MNQQQDLFGNREYEYTVVIEPADFTKTKVKELKRMLNRFIPVPEKSLHAIPHITLGYCYSSDANEATIIKGIQETIGSMLPFEVEIDGVTTWNNGTLILNVAPSEKIQRLMVLVQEALGKKSGKTPHLTIAKNLQPKLLATIPLEEFNYAGTFTCDTISVLKMDDAPAERSETIARFHLGNKD